MEIKFVSGNFKNWNLGELESWNIIWKWKFWKLDLRIGVSENYLKMKIWKLNLRIGILKNYLKTEVLKIKI